jgi:hypothetical protein
LLLYVAASHVAVSAALVQERQDKQAKKHVPIYFISKVLSSSKRNYTKLKEGTICCANGLQKASELFLVISHHSTFVPIPRGHHKKQRRYRKSWKMGCRTK